MTRSVLFGTKDWRAARTQAQKGGPFQSRPFPTDLNVQAANDYFSQSRWKCRHQDSREEIPLVAASSLAFERARELVAVSQIEVTASPGPGEQLAFSSNNGASQQLE